MKGQAIVYQLLIKRFPSTRFKSRFETFIYGCLYVILRFIISNELTDASYLFHPAIVLTFYGEIKASKDQK